MWARGRGGRCKMFSALVPIGAIFIIQKYKYQQYWATQLTNVHSTTTAVSEHFQVLTPQEPLLSHAVNLLSTFLQWFYVDKCPTLSTCSYLQKGVLWTL